MKRVLTIMTALILLTACASAPTAITTAVPTVTLAPTATFTLTQLPTATSTATLTATPYATNTPRPTDTPRPPTLRGLADKLKFKIGSQIIWENVVDPRVASSYKEIASKDFNELVIDGELIWGGTLVGTPKHIRPNQSTFNFEKADLLVDFAVKNGMSVQAHHLVWGLYFSANRTVLPDWVLKGNFSRDELVAIMQEHIRTVMEHYKGKVRAYTVVNEPFPYNQKVDFWFDRIGEVYIDIAFETARKADPNAILILNDAENFSLDNRRATYDYTTAQRLRNKTVEVNGKAYPLIDAVGIQMYIDAARAPTKEQLKATMKKYGEAGVRVYVTEALVSVAKLTGSPEEKQKTQADIYADMLSACLESGVCDGFAVFGLSDRTSKYVMGQDSFASPMDENFNPKPAYFAIRNVLTGK